MKPIGTFIGTVSTQPEIREIPGKNSFVQFTVECGNSLNKYVDRVKCLIYSKDLNDILERIWKDDTVAMTGDFSAEAYISKQTSKPVGMLKAFIRSWEVINRPPPPTSTEMPDKPPTQTRHPTAAATATPLTLDGDDEVPF